MSRTPATARGPCRCAPASGRRNQACAVRQASHISAHDASNATDSPGQGPGHPVRSGCPARRFGASASTKAAALRWVTATPFLGVPVEPDVKMIQASSRASGGLRTPAARRAGGPAQAGFGDRPDDARPPNTRSARSRAVGVDRGYSRPGGSTGSLRTARNCSTASARRSGHHGPIPRALQPFDAGLDVPRSVRCRSTDGAVVDRRGVGVTRGGVAQDVDQMCAAPGPVPTAGTGRGLPVPGRAVSVENT